MLGCSVGITAVVNLQCIGEHASCGDGIVESGFSNTPETFMQQGSLLHAWGQLPALTPYVAVSCYNFKWLDFGVPTIDSLLDMTKVLASVLIEHGKVAIHCHSGLGRRCVVTQLQST